MSLNIAAKFWRISRSTPAQRSATAQVWCDASLALGAQRQRRQPAAALQVLLAVGSVVYLVAARPARQNKLWEFAAIFAYVVEAVGWHAPTADLVAYAFPRFQRQLFCVLVAGTRVFPRGASFDASRPRGCRAELPSTRRGGAATWLCRGDGSRRRVRRGRTRGATLVSSDIYPRQPGARRRGCDVLGDESRRRSSPRTISTSQPRRRRDASPRTIRRRSRGGAPLLTYAPVRRRPPQVLGDAAALRVRGAPRVGVAQRAAPRGRRRRGL